MSPALSQKKLGKLLERLNVEFHVEVLALARMAEDEVRSEKQRWTMDEPQE